MVRNLASVMARVCCRNKTLVLDISEERAMLHGLSLFQFIPGILFWLTPGILLFLVMRKDGRSGGSVTRVRGILTRGEAKTHPRSTFHWLPFEPGSCRARPSIR
jgi:hypothetical protein